MRKQKNTISKIFYLIFIGILIAIIIKLYGIYRENNFNDFKRSELQIGTSEFKRDEKIKYSELSSYRITSEEYNDAMFSKKIKVTPNTPYKITCMVKTENVETEENKKGAGAQIATSDTTERSVAISGTKDWQKIEFIFNSKNREEVDVGFRLGGNTGRCKGTAWFSDFTIEEGVAENTNEWNFVCFIFTSTDVNINGKEIKINTTKENINDITNTLSNFKNTCEIISNGKMVAKCDAFTVETPITSLSYDKEFGYYVAPEDIEEQIKQKIKGSNYDHIFAVVKLGDEEHQNDIEINDWIGLGAMDYYGIGFSNIRLPNETKSYIYKYDSRINTFPEEVFLHEFLHSLERTSKEYGYTIPELHAYQQYGYQNERLIGQKRWYKDYMNKQIKDEQNNNIGLPEEIYTIKPAKSADFEYSYKIDEFKQPQNFIEEVLEIIEKVRKKIT